MEMKVFYFLAILGATQAFDIPCPPNCKANVDTSIQTQLSTLLQSSDHTSLLNLSQFGKAKEILERANFTNVGCVEKISGLQNINLLPALPDFRSSIEHARSRVAAALGVAGGDMEAAIQLASIKAIHSANVVVSMAEIVYIILSTYYDLAVHAAFGIATIPILQEGLLVATSSVHVVIGVAGVV